MRWRVWLRIMFACYCGLVMPLVVSYTYAGVMSDTEQRFHLICLLWGVLMIIWLLMNIVSMLTLSKRLIVLACMLDAANGCYMGAVSGRVVDIWGQPYVAAVYVSISLWFLAILAIEIVNRIAWSGTGANKRP